MQYLLELLRRETASRAIDEAECEAMLALAEEEHVLPSVAACVRLQQATLTPTLLSRVDKIERDAAIAAFYWCSELKGVLREFDRQGVVAVPLKGPFLAERLYGSSALRVSVDLDLLVARADLARAEAVLTETCFVPDVADDYHRAWRRQTTTVELHHDVENPLAFNFDVASALRRVRRATFQGENTWQLAPDDELLFLCLHAARHRYERLSPVLDLRLAFEKLTSTPDRWQPRPEVGQLCSLLTLGLAMARRLQPDLIVAIDFGGSKRQTEHLEGLADRLWRRLLTQPREPLDWRTLHEFFLRIELPGWPRIHRRYRHLKILWTRVIEPDYAFAARLGLHRPWQARILRPLRLLSDSLRPLSRNGGTGS